LAKKKDIFFGRQPALEILQSEKTVDKIMLQKGATGEDLNLIRKIAEERSVQVQYVPKEKINYLLHPIFQGQKVNHQGVLGFYGAIQYYKLDDIMHQVLMSGEHALFVLLDGVTDVRNIGAIARSAVCMGAHALVVPQKGSAQINAEGIKASAGALNEIPVCKEKDLESAIEFLKLNGVSIVGSSLKADKKLKEVDFNKPVAVVLGSEGFGMSPWIQKMCDETFIIPMKGNLNSLNVSVSNGIILYEALSQRMGS
jgi:23S rRNA (guanosine2251-2'-O)-methyltransferase